jgi:DNA invertase Pin-like site-specific DNA recombinase
MNPKLTSDRLRRRAVVYVRQSSPTQLAHNHESRLRQYGLVDRARELGFMATEVIDDDLGRSGSGMVERPGFERLVAAVCSGEVGAVFCIEASRLARNGRDWHHLIELCGMVGAVVVDPDGVYDPGLINDRLLLGLKGTMSEFELNLIRQRSLEAARQKARRGELQFRLPVGFRWTQDGKIEIDPDRRIQQAIELVFRKNSELGSARQVLLWFRDERVSLPSFTFDKFGEKTAWKLPVYHSILAVLSNPVYAGAYAFGKTEARTKVIGGRAHKTEGHKKAREEWMVLIRDHHPGYISWEQYERNQMTLAENTHRKYPMQRKSGRGGRALLAGLLRCRRCGRMLHVTYSGSHGEVVRYHCRGAHINHGGAWCISFGGLRPDEAIASEILKTIAGNAIEAAIEAAERVASQQQDRRHILLLELEQCRYQSQLATRRYEAVDPGNRLVAAELETRWNTALKEVRRLEQELQRFDAAACDAPVADRDTLVSLAQDLPAVWNSATTDMTLKQRIVRILIREVVADVEEQSSETVLLIHWAGGRHSELRVKRNGTGKHGRCTSLEAVEVVQRMAGNFRDDQIAATLNRLGLRTGAGNTWREGRVRTLRSYHGIPAYDAAQTDHQTLTLEQAAEQLRVAIKTMRRLIDEKVVAGVQVVPCAPWQISAQSLESESVFQRLREIRSRTRAPQTPDAGTQSVLFSAL